MAATSVSVAAAVGVAAVRAVRPSPAFWWSLPDVQVTVATHLHYDWSLGARVFTGVRSPQSAGYAHLVLSLGPLTVQWQVHGGRLF
jgi:glyoxylase-like metal-dependent hydrolase (beta-lactamase superfamily II)